MVKALGPETTRNSVRLFMVPGMDHCFGDNYETAPTFNVDTIAILKEWKASGTAPDEMIVTYQRKGEAGRPGELLMQDALNGLLDRLEDRK